MTTSILKMKEKEKKICSEEKTNPTATETAWDWVIEFLADLENVDATFIDDLLSNVPQGYNLLSNNAKDKVVLKRLEKMISKPAIIRSKLTYAARRKMIIATPVSFAINPSEPARVFYDRLMSKRGLDTSTFQENIKVCIRRFILQKRACLPKCVLPKQAELLVECCHASAKRPNVTGMKSAKVKKVRFADESPTVYPVSNAVNSNNHCTMVNVIIPLIKNIQEAPSEDIIVSGKRKRNEFTKDNLIDLNDAESILVERSSDRLGPFTVEDPSDASKNIQEAPSEDIIVSGKRNNNEFTKDQLIDLDDAEAMLIKQNSDRLVPFSLERPSGGSVSSIQNEATNLEKDHVVSKRMKRSMIAGQMEHCGSGITCNNNNMLKEILLGGLHGKSSVDETKNGSGKQTNPETSSSNVEILNKAHLSYANEVFEIAMMNGQSSPLTLVQDSSETDCTQEYECIRCQKKDQLLICNTCSLLVHENCLGSSASFNDTGNFVCPACLHSQAKIVFEEAKKNFELAKKKFELAGDHLLQFINKEHVREKIVSSETLGELNDLNMAGKGFGIDSNGNRKEIVKNQAIAAQVYQQEAEIGIVHDKTPHGVPCTSEGIKQKQVNNCVDGRVVKTRSSLDFSSVQCHGNLNEQGKRTNIRVERSDASNLPQQSISAPKSASPYLSGIANIQYEGTQTVSSGEKPGDVGKKNADLQELPVNAPNGSSLVLGTETVQKLADVVCLAPDVCAETVLADQGLAGVGATNAGEKQQTGTSPRRSSPPPKENVENKAENGNGDGCLEFQRRRSPQRRKSSRLAVVLPHRPSSPSNENVEEISENGNDDESEPESKKPVRQNSKNTRVNRRHKRTLWTPEEEQTLKEGVQFLNCDGGKIPWKKILDFGRDIFHESRLPDDLKDKWRTMWKLGCRAI